MPKLKTHKATNKRFRKTRNDKFIQRSTTQDHFNAREEGKHTRSKRLDHIAFSGNKNNIKKSLPYS